MLHILKKLWNIFEKNTSPEEPIQNTSVVNESTNIQNSTESSSNSNDIKITKIKVNNIKL